MEQSERLVDAMSKQVPSPSQILQMWSSLSHSKNIAHDGHGAARTVEAAFCNYWNMFDILKIRVQPRTASAGAVRLTSC